MSNLGRILAKNLAGSGVKIFPGSIGNVRADVEWIKWLSYEPKFEKERIVYLSSKNLSDLSGEELAEIARYKKNKEYLRLFKIYGKDDCTNDDFMKVYDYMCNESIMDLMKSKLTHAEIKAANIEIERLINIPEKELRDKVKNEQKFENYEKLSMVDAYILHVISRVDYVRDINDLDRRINFQIKQNDVMREKSYYYAMHPNKY